MKPVDQWGIVGRNEPLRRIGVAVAASAQGRRSAVLVSGTAGIGKTSLIRAAVDRALGDTLVVGWGTCWHGRGAPGFWPWTQALDDLVRLVGTDEAVATAGKDHEMLASLIRAFGPAPASTDDLDRHRLLLLDAAVRWLEALAGDRHVVIVLDDLQWADSSTFDLLDHMIAAPVSARLLVIGAYRHDELDDDALARLAAVGARCDSIALEGLSAAEVEELMAGIRGAETARLRAPELHRRTGGHPLFVSELARLPEFGSGGPLPTVVTGAVARRLSMVTERTRELLDAASVLGNRLLLDVLGAVIEQPPADVLHLVGSAEAAGLIHTVAGDEYRFAHDLFRETLYRRLEAERRVRLHGRVGAALEARARQGGSVAPGDLAFHFAQAAGTGDPLKAIHWAREAAADERQRSAFAEAAGHLRRGRSAALDSGWVVDPELLARILIDEADSQARSGEPDVARSLLRNASKVAPDPRCQADVALAVQRLGARFAAPRDEIIAHLDAALAAVTGVDPALEAQVGAALARELQHSVSDDRRRAGPLSEAALALGRASDHDETLIACLLARHDTIWRPGTGVERAALGHEIAGIGARLRDVDRQAEGLILEANGLLESGSARFRLVLDRWFELLETRDEPRDRYMVQTRRAALALLSGDSEAAEATMYRAAQIGEHIHEPDTGNVLMSQRVALARARNDPDELRALARDAVRWWTGAPVLAHSVAAGAHAAAGDLQAAAREIAMVADCGGWQSEGSYLRSVLVMHLAEAAAAVDDLELCTALLADITPLVDNCGVNGAVVAFAGPFAHSAGILAGALGDVDTARRMLQGSIETAQKLGAAVWVRQGESAQRGSTSRAEHASLVRAGKVWTVAWREEQGSLPHAKGLADLAVLVQRPGQAIHAMQLVGAVAPPGAGAQEVIDLEALGAYRTRLDAIAADIDHAGDAADIGRIEHLENEREQLLAEIRRATGLGGRLRTNANDPGERARKAVSARIRDAIRRIDAVAPMLACHLDRSLHTGFQCSYAPPADEPSIIWTVDG
ncbi:MAG: ATP-binding protein [Acidimicrobiales bacterium]